MTTGSNYSKASHSSLDNGTSALLFGSHNFSANGSTGNSTLEPGSNEDPYWGYRMRFGPYTALSVCCVTFNVLSLVAMTRIRGRRTVHHTLLLNLATCDIIGSLLLWMYYNSVIIFPRFPLTNVGHCLFIVVVLVAPFILSLCSSSLSLLMLALNQYIAICSPLFSATNVSRGRIICCIICAWLLSAILSMVPAFIMLFLTRIRVAHCGEYAVGMGVKSLEICTYALAGLIVIIVCLYGGIYREIVRYRSRTPQLGAGVRRTGRNGETEKEHSYKAFVTTLLLAGTLVFFWLPYMVFNFVSLHVEVEAMPDLVWQVKFYVIDFMPMLNFLTDPIIYGIRMREIRDAYHRLFAKLLPRCIDEPRRPLGRASVKFSTLETSTGL